MRDWLSFFRAPQVNAADVGKVLILTATTTVVPPDFWSALKTHLGETVHLRVGGDGGCPAHCGALGRWLGKLKPRRIIVLGPLPVTGDCLAASDAPLAWISAEQADASGSGAQLITVRSAVQQRQLPQAQVVGDPLLGLAAPAMTDDDGLCGRFKEIRERDRWVLYFAGTEEGEENLAYATFLQLSRKGVGLLVLAPRDPARYEPVYREAMRFHLMTNRHRRLMTSYIPHKTRVYYLEDPQVGRAMHQCADVVVAGGTLVTSSATVDLIPPLRLGRPVIAGPLRDSSLLGAAVADGAVLSVESAEALEAPLAALLASRAEQAHQGQRGQAWIQLQLGAQERVFDLLG